MIRNRSIFMSFYCIFSLSLCLFDKNLNEQQSQWIVTRFDQYQFNDLINFFFVISCNYFWCLFSSSAHKRRWTLKCMCDLFVFLLIKIENSSSNNSKKKNVCVWTISFTVKNIYFIYSIWYKTACEFKQRKPMIEIWYHYSSWIFPE